MRDIPDVLAANGAFPCASDLPLVGLPSLLFDGGRSARLAPFRLCFVCCCCLWWWWCALTPPVFSIVACFCTEFVRVYIGGRRLQVADEVEVLWRAVLDPDYLIKLELSFFFCAAAI